MFPIYSNQNWWEGWRDILLYSYLYLCSVSQILSLNRLYCILIYFWVLLFQFVIGMSLFVDSAVTELGWYWETFWVFTRVSTDIVWTPPLRTGEKISANALLGGANAVLPRSLLRAMRVTFLRIFIPLLVFRALSALLFYWQEFFIV